MIKMVVRKALNVLPEEGGVYYLQSQNGNMFSSDEGDSPSEFDALRSDIVSEIDWCSEALGGWNEFWSRPLPLNFRAGRQPEAVNVWIGNGKSVTSIHSGKPRRPLTMH